MHSSNNDFRVKKHDHGAYMIGWCAYTDPDWWFEFRRNPFSLHYDYHRHMSWEDGFYDASQTELSPFEQEINDDPL